MVISYRDESSTEREHGVAPNWNYKPNPPCHFLPADKTSASTTRTEPAMGDVMDVIDTFRDSGISETV